MAENFEMTVVDNTREILSQLDDAVERCLEECGLRAEGYAKLLTPVGTPESTGVEGYHTSGLRNSITHKVVKAEKTVYVGSNHKTQDGKPLAIYVELGTGVYAAKGNGRKSPWVWVDKNGKPHKTNGMKPKHMIFKALTEHSEEYQKVIKRHLRGNI